MLLGFLERASTRLLELDEDALGAIAALRGRVVAVVLRGPDLRFSVKPHDGGLAFSAGSAAAPDVIITGTPSALLRYLLAGDAAAVDELEIAGDVMLARRLLDILSKVRPDWEERVSLLIGDTGARQLGRAAGATASFLRNAGRSFAADAGEYLRYEKQVLPEREVVAGFVDSVDALRDRVTRLKARLTRLERRVPPAA